jgi:hypothetical protein
MAFDKEQTCPLVRKNASLATCGAESQDELNDRQS